METKIWYTIDQDYKQLQAYLKNVFQSLSKEEQDYLKSQGFSLKKNYCELIDFYRLIHREMKPTYFLFKHKLLMTTKNPVGKILKKANECYELEKKQENIIP